MTAYFINVLVMLVLVSAMAIGAIWLWRRVQPGMALGPREKLVKIVDAAPMGATGRLAVVEFGDRHILIAVARGRIDKLAEAPIDTGLIDDGGEPAPPASPFDRFLAKRP